MWSLYRNTIKHITFNNQRWDSHCLHSSIFACLFHSQEQYITPLALNLPPEHAATAPILPIGCSALRGEDPVFPQPTLMTRASSSVRSTTTTAGICSSRMISWRLRMACSWTWRMRNFSYKYLQIPLWLTLSSLISILRAQAPNVSTTSSLWFWPTRRAILRWMVSLQGLARIYHLSMPPKKQLLRSRGLALTSTSSLLLYS